MAPMRTKKSKSSSENDVSARPKTTAFKSPMRTPSHSPQKKIASITETQKQALIDNLQLEVTERARKLRAQYALQAQSLRTRIELRINRIPNSLRKAKIGDLYETYQEISEPKQHSLSREPKPEQPENVPAKEEGPANALPIVASTDTPQARDLKRNSDAMEVAEKENISGATQVIPNPKKRTKVAKGPSRQVTNPSSVLSPKSANSRTLPQSPIRPTLGPPQKSNLSHPASPPKQVSPFKAASPAKAAAAAATANLAAMVAEKPKAGRPKAGTNRKATNPNTTTKSGTGRSKRGVIPASEPEDVRKVSNTSSVSSASNATIVRKAKGTLPAGSKNNTIGVRAVGKKVVAGAEAPPPGRRVLRKRG